MAVLVGSSPIAGMIVRIVQRESDGSETLLTEGLADNMETHYEFSAEDFTRIKITADCYVMQNGGPLFGRAPAQMAPAIVAPQGIAPFAPVLGERRFS